MEVKIRAAGFGEVRTMLRNIAEKVPDIARANFKRSAARIVKQAKINVPEDTTALRESIRIEKSYGTHGRLQIDIIAGADGVVTINGRTVDLDEYALLVHEAYETAVAVNGPGKRTAEKMAEHPDAIIGSGFLRRAAEGEEEKITRVMGQEITQLIEREQKK